MNADNSLELARQWILAPAGLIDRDLDRVMAELLSAPLDDAELYFQSSRYESRILEDGIIKEGSHSIEQGAGVRGISGEKTGFAYSDDIELRPLLDAAKNVTRIARSGTRARIGVQSSKPAPSLYRPVDPLQSIPEEQKIELLNS
ncbi:MAG: PmbA/TldA family metallopeptidase, partial [Gammaproteobacteria bacterium]